MIFTKNAATQATAHCIITTSAAHFPPSSRFTEAIAATHGVYRRQKVRRQTAARGVSTSVRAAVLPNKMDSVETTLSFAIKPVTRAVENLQSPKPRGLNTGATSPATTARILSLESVTIFRCRSKVCKNQITIVATKITVKALCRKSFAFSQSSCPTFFAPGRR